MDNLLYHYSLSIALTNPPEAARPDTVPNGTRIIWVSSGGHRGAPKPDGINWDDMDMHEVGGLKGALLKYPQSKAMMCIFAHELARLYGPRGLVSLSLHPGGIKSNFQQHQPALVKLLTRPLLHDQYYGGLTELFAGFVNGIDTTMMEEGGRNGSYIEPWGNWGVGAAHVYDGLAHRQTGERLWKHCEDLLKDWI